MHRQSFRVLLVMPEGEERTRLLDMLQAPGLGLAVEPCPDLDAAISLCVTSELDAALADLAPWGDQQMEALSIFTAARPDLPVIALARAGDPEGADVALLSGAKEWLFKDQLTGPMAHLAVRGAVARRLLEVDLSLAVSRLTELGQGPSDMGSGLRQEIEKRERIQRDLAESRQMLHTITDNIPALVAFVGADRRYRFANRRYEETFGYSRDKILGIHVKDLMGDLYDRQVREKVDAVLAGRTTEYELNLFDQSSKENRWLQVTYIPSRDQNGEVNGYFVLANDITERRKVAANLMAQRQLLQDILDGLGAAVFFIDQETDRIAHASDIAAMMLGRRPSEIIGAKYYDILCDPDADDPRRECFTHKNVQGDFKFKRPDGSIFPATKTLLPVSIDGRKHDVMIIFDITERKAMERQLAYAQKLESVGQLAAGIAHEINTPIQYVGSNIQFLQTVFGKLLAVMNPEHPAAARKDPDVFPNSAVRKPASLEDIAPLIDEAPQALADALEGVERVASIVQAMKKFSHPDVEERKQVNVNDAVTSTVTIARNEWKYVADVNMDLDPDLAMIHAVPGDVNQVILNLLVNAAHAIRDNKDRGEEKGVISIRTRNAEGQVELVVADTGCGIPEADKPRIFDPFFTTKEVGKGTGQGLAITLSILKKHGGSIDFESQVGQGTTFTVLFPLSLSFLGDSHEP